MTPELTAALDEVSAGEMTTGKRAEKLLAILLDAEQAQRPWATAQLRAATLAGLGGQIKRHMKARCLVSVKRRKAPSSTVIGVPRFVNDRVQWHQVTMADATLDELVSYREMLRTNAAGIRANLRNVDRVIDMVEKVPGASTAGQAAASLGTTIEEVLAA